MVDMGQWKLAADLRIQRWKRLPIGLRGLSLMAMHNPPHPGEFIRETYIEPFSISIRSLAENLGVAASTVARIVSERSAVSPEMALRLSKALGRSPESWLAMQDNYDLWQARKSANLSQVRKIQFEATA
jgi:addiction module HigA family antidote